MDCNEDSQGMLVRRARTKRGSKLFNVGVSLSATQMNADEDFSWGRTSSIFLLALTAYVSDLMSGARMITKPCAHNCRLSYPGYKKNLMHRLAILHPTNV